MKKIEDTYKVLDQVSHVLLRPQTYVGSNKPHKSIKWIIENDKMVEKEIIYIPSFIKIFDEVIINSIDASKKNKKLNRIDVIVDQLNNKISVKDNGGIPIIIHKEHKKYVPEIIFGTLMSGSNYDDSENREGAGLNGLGVKLTNIFSKQFTISTCDGKNQFDQIFSDNMRKRTKAKVKAATRSHTQISYIPDLEKFGLQSIDEDHLQMIQKRVYDIAACNPGIKVYFNGTVINFKSFEDYIKLYTSDFFYESKKDKTWSIGIAPSDNGFQQVSFVNSTDTYEGGTHLDYAMNQIIFALREFFNKKHKVDVKPSELRNHMFIFLNATVINPAFSSQTKDKLITEVKEFGSTFEVSAKLIQSILKSEIVSSILDWIQQKKDADENKLARDLNKNLAKIKVDKLIDAKGRDRWKCSLALFEGDSASSPFRKYRDQPTQGAFSLRGKFMNTSDITSQKLVSNNEVINLMGAMGLKLGHKVVPGTLRYGKILIYTDADPDGSSIAALLINFLYKYWPELFEHNMVYKVETPIVVCTNKAKKKIPFYTQQEYNLWLKKINPKEWEIKYKKGLAALKDDEYKEIIQNPRLTKIKRDDFSKESLNIWFGKESDLRKTELLK